MARKIHTRLKRKHCIHTHLNPYSRFHPQKRSRPKTFTTEAAAQAWAEQHGLKQYSLIKVKNNQKFQIIAEK